MLVRTNQPTDKFMIIDEKAPLAKRRKLWEINGRFHCSLIGTCVQMSELRQVAKRCRILLPDHIDEYHLHSAFVNMADQLSPAIRMLQKMVDKRFANEIRTFAKIKTSDELADLWASYFSQGKIAGAYWALLSHPLVTKEIANQAHGEVHMLSHKASISYQADLQLLAEQRIRGKELEKQLANTNDKLRITVQERDTALEKLKTQLRHNMALTQQLKMTSEQLSSLENGDANQALEQQLAIFMAQNDILRTRASKAETERDTYRYQCDIAEGKIKALSIALREFRQQQQLWQEGDQFQESTATQNIPSCAQDTQSDALFDLCGRCVLVVGGRTGQCEHFRKLVEQHNGRFIHHDGGREHSRQQLAITLQQADAVFCPLDNISHDAINRVKRYCKHTTKRVVFMPRSSLSSFAESLRQVAE